MTKEELAAQYAASKMEEINALLQEAYLKGYEQGGLKVASTINVDGVKYYDLGLPSGTLWSSPLCDQNGYRFLPYLEAEKLNIPTTNQFVELRQFTRPTVRQIDGCFVEVVGLTERLPVWVQNGKGYMAKRYEGEGLEQRINAFWLKSSLKNGRTAEALAIRDGDGDMFVIDHFAGYKLPVILVKNKADL